MKIKIKIKDFEFEVSDVTDNSIHYYVEKIKDVLTHTVANYNKIIK